MTLINQPSNYERDVFIIEMCVCCANLARSQVSGVGGLDPPFSSAEASPSPSVDRKTILIDTCKKK